MILKTKIKCFREYFLIYFIIFLVLKNNYTSIEND